MALLYTSLAKVRREAGFTNNSNIDDTNDITPHAEDAEGEVIASIGARYSLPLADNTYWAGSPGEAMIAQISTRLAAGYLMLQVYEGQGGVIEEMAWKKVNAARARLKMIEKGNLTLRGTDGGEFSTNESGQSGIQGHPASNSIDDGTKAKFSMDDKF